MPAAAALFGALLLTLSLGACNNGQQQQTRSYCDSTGCYNCIGDQCYPTSGNPTTTNPAPGTACTSDAACGSGNVCNLGLCQAGCGADTDCTSGDTCISGRCRPAGSATCGTAGAFCAAATNCGSERSCVAGSCASACAADADCVLGQVCSNSACVNDPSPKVAQCLFDIDCANGAGGFRCINAYCMKNCTATSDCKSGATCLQGTCRADPRPTT
jgi:hypothetical protein